MYYVLKNDNAYMGPDGMLTDNRSAALKIDAALVQAIRHGNWPDNGLFRDADDRNCNGIGVRIVKVNEATSSPASDVDAPPVYAAGRRL